MAKKSSKTIGIKIPTSGELLSDIQMKFAELTELLNAIGKDNTLLEKGIHCNSIFKSKRLASGKSQVFFSVKATLPPVNVDITL